MSDDDKKRRGKKLMSVPIKKRAPSEPPSAGPPSLTDTVGSAIFEQRRSWLRVRSDPTDHRYQLVKLRLAAPADAMDHTAVHVKVWTKEHPAGFAGVQALRYLARAGHVCNQLGLLLLGSYTGTIEPLVSADPLEALTADAVTALAEGVNLSFALHERPSVVEVRVRIQAISGLAEDRPLEVHGSAAIGQALCILGLVYDQVRGGVGGEA